MKHAVLRHASRASHAVGGGFRRVAALCAAAGLATMLAVAPGLAQEKKAAPPAAAAAGKAGEAKKQTQWVKLCDKLKMTPKAKEGEKAEPQEKELCSTMFEAIESNTGQIIVSVGLQTIEGAPKQILAVMVPLGMIIPGGVKLAVYNKEQWEKAAKNETIELKDLKSIDLKFAHCLPVGCTAEIQATPEIIDTLKGGAGLAVLAIWTTGRQFTVPVPLGGFGEALAGKPVDNKEYAENRKRLMAAIRQRQVELMEKRKAEEMKNLPPPPGAETGATAPKTK